MKDKLFFFVAYQGDRFHTISTRAAITVTVRIAAGGC